MALGRELKMCELRNVACQGPATRGWWGHGRRLDTDLEPGNCFQPHLVSGTDVALQGRACSLRQILIARCIQWTY